MAKISAALILASLLLMSVFVSSSATMINYGDLGADSIWGRPKPQPVNGYSRGCLAADRCRGGRKLLNDDSSMETAVVGAEGLMHGAETEAVSLVQGTEKDAEDLKQKIIQFFQF